MKNMKTTILSAALTSCMLLAGTAQAAYGTIDATLNTLSPGNSNGVGGGVFNFTKTGGTNTFALLNGPAGNFIGFCLDVVDGIGVPSSHTWTVDDVSAAPIAAGAMGATKATDIGRLVQGVLGGSFANVGTVLNSNLKAAGFQLALWEIVNESSANAYDATANWVWGTSDATVRAQANTYLGMMAATGASGLFSLTSSTTQDFLVQAVPIPAAAWLLGSGLLGLFGLARRKTAVATA